VGRASAQPLAAAPGVGYNTPGTVVTLPRHKEPPVMNHTARAVLFGLLACTTAAAADNPLTLDVWPGKAPGETGAVGEEKFQDPRPNEAKPVKRLTNVSKPTLTVFRPEKGKDTGAAVVIAPGGGYNILAWDLEGEEVAAWLNKLGVTGIVLKYRVPRRPTDVKDKPPIGAQQDAQRAMSLVRSKAKELGIDPKRIGMLGFSAGGNLTATTAVGFEKRTYEMVDEVDKVSCRPDFVVLIYPAYLVEKDTGKLIPEMTVTAQTPQMFLAHASDDPVTPESSVAMYLALKRAKVPAELHVYASGGHGFGLREGPRPALTWPKRCEEWMRSRGLLTAKE
jgi:acetyl esterase/lipase